MQFGRTTGILGLIAFLGKHLGSTQTAKLLGQLVTHHEVRSTNVLVSADYLQLRQAIVTALQPFPEAARAVGQALHALETSAAAAITANAAKGKPLLLEAEALA